MKALENHQWKFFQKGGFDQVYIETPADLANLKYLDQKLWAALVCTLDGLEFNSKFFNYIDANGDGRIRAPELLGMIDFALKNLAKPEVLFEKGNLQLTDLIDDAGLQESAKYVLEVLGRDPAEGLSYQDTADFSKLFPSSRINGDGIVPADLTDDADLKGLIAQIISFSGGKADRSGQQGVDAGEVAAFFAGLSQLAAWQQESEAEFIEQLSANENAELARLAALVGEDNIVELASTDLQQKLQDLIAHDLSEAEVANSLIELDKLLLCKEFLITLLRNFVSFQDFYLQEQPAIFQAGRLYIDGKSCDFTFEVADVDAHAALAVNSFNYLLYCECTRPHDPAAGVKKIVAGITAGEEGDLVVGRHGLFYDRTGLDWDAQVVKVIANPISIREAFWAPYRRIAKFISDKIQQLAADRDADVVNQAIAKAKAEGEDGKPSAFDIGKFAGIFAAIGLAMAAMGAALAALGSSMSGLVWWQWIAVFIGIILFISGPSLLLAWFKLRRRNFGPILDANGWAVNSRSLINIPFGTQLTQLAHLPKGSKQVILEKKSKTKYWFLLAVAGIAGWLAYKYELISNLSQIAANL